MRRAVLSGAIAALLLGGGAAIAGTAAAAPAAEAPAGGAQSSASAEAAAAIRGPLRCRRGFRRVVVKVRRGRRWVRVARCRKVPAKPKPRPVPGPGPSPQPGPAPPPVAPALFEAPGRELTGEAAKPFLQRYLISSRFTDCPAGWPNCGPLEYRYAHFPDGSFHYCRLTSTIGADIRAASSYQVMNAVVRADGSWAFDEMVPSGGNPSYYEWHVSTQGVVTGIYRNPAGELSQVGPLQYVAQPLDCSF